jgi:Tfp pilus assembly protein PilO
LFIKPTISSLADTSPKVRDIQRRLNLTRQDIANIATYKMQVEDLRKRLSAYKKKFSTTQQIDPLLKELSEMAQISGVKIIAIKPHLTATQIQQNLANVAYQKFPISITAICSYHELGTFLNKLENADIFMRVTDIKIIGNAENPAEHDVYILVNTYVFAEGR